MSENTSEGELPTFLDYTKLWLNQINRDGLLKVNNDVFLLFQAMEVAVRRVLTISTVVLTPPFLLKSTPRLQYCMIQLHLHTGARYYPAVLRWTQARVMIYWMRLAINGQEYVDTHLLQDTLNSTKELKVRATNKNIF